MSRPSDSRAEAGVRIAARICMTMGAAMIPLSVAVSLVAGHALPFFTPGVVLIAFMYLSQVAGYRRAAPPWWLAPQRRDLGSRQSGRRSAPEEHRE